MQLWNFCHNVLGMHVYYVLAIAVVAIMGIAFAIQRHNQKRRNEEIENMSDGQQTAAAPDTGAGK